MRLTRTLSTLLLGTTLVLSGCTSVPVQQDYNPQHSFKEIKALSWLPLDNPKAAEMQRFEQQEPLTSQRIRTAIIHQLDAQAIRLTPNGSQGYISYHLESQKQLIPDPMDVRIGIGHYGRFGGFMFNTPPNMVEEKTWTLIIDIHRASGEVIWRGSADSYALQGETPQESQRIITDLVQAILKQFPPQ